MNQTFLEKEGAVDDNEKKSGASFISPGGAGVAAVCFFLPWVKACGQTASGADLGGIFWVVFLAAIAIIGAFFYFGSRNEVTKSKRVAVFGSLAGVGILIWKYFEARRELGGAIDFEVGAIGTILGFAAAFLGAVFVKGSPRK